MGKITDFLIEQIKKQISENHIVVWFDYERNKPQYTEVIKTLEIPDTTIIQYEGSFLKMRHEAFPLMVNERPPNLLLYIPMEEKATENALVGFTKTGVVMKPGQSPWQRNTRLAVLARQVLKGTLNESEIQAIEKKVESSGSFSLQDLDQIADTTSRVNLDVLSLVFGSRTPSDITLQYLTNPQKDPEIMEKSALPDLKSLLEVEFGLSPRGISPEESRGEIARYLLLSAWSAELKGKLPDALREVPKATQSAQVRACLTLAQAWRMRSDLAESYVRLADKVEQTLGIPDMKLSLNTLQQSVTFRSSEEQLFHHVVAALLKGTGQPADEYMQLVLARKEGFWAVQDSILKTRWNLLLTLISFFTISFGIERGLKEKEWSAEDLIRSYTQSDQPWCEMDTLHRRFEEQYDAITLGSSYHSDDLDAICQKARTSYTAIGGMLAQTYQKAIARNQGFPRDMLKQQEIFKHVVSPHIGQERVAYILIDAFRYEMAQEFLQIIGAEFETTLQPALGMVPSITEIGMAALMPGAEKGIDLSTSGSGEIIIRIENTPLQDRKSRIAFFKEKNHAATLDLKLGDLFVATKALKDKVKKADIVLVTSQEIDILGESTEPGQFRRYISDIFSSLKRAIYNLERNGIRKFIITADHGFIFGEEIQSGMKIEPPGGETMLIKRRVWAGVGGARHDATLRFSAAQFGFDGDYDLVIPQGFAVFTVPGGGLTYLHGGLSLQEQIVPVMTITIKDQAPVSEAKIQWNIQLSGRQEITTRTCMVIINGRFTSIDNIPPKIRVEVRQDNISISRPLIASVGYEEATGDIQLKLKENTSDLEPVTVTLQITGTVKVETANIHIFDAQTGAEYKKLANIPVRITF
jgi:hypothetical protein